MWQLVPFLAGALVFSRSSIRYNGNYGLRVRPLASLLGSSSRERKIAMMNALNASYSAIASEQNSISVPLETTGVDVLKELFRSVAIAAEGGIARDGVGSSSDGDRNLSVFPSFIE